jgi:hypothetical protein
MKTSIKTLIAVALTAVVLTSASVNTFAENNKKETILNEVKGVSKINVSGNVELILVQSLNESVKVYDDYYAKNALVQQKGGELRISSFEKETLTVVVYVNNLSEITASNNATVRTFGKLSTLSLNVNLKDNAVANLNVKTLEMTTDLSGISKLTLTGCTDSYNGLMGSFSKVDLSQYAADNKNIQSKNNAVAKKSVITTLLLPDAE